MPNTEKPMVVVKSSAGNVYLLHEIEAVIPAQVKSRPKVLNRCKRPRRRNLYGVDQYTRLRLKQLKTLRAFHLSIFGRRFSYLGDDRSEVIFQVAKGLAEAGFSREQTAEMVQNTVFWQERESEGKVEDIDRMLDKIDFSVDFAPEKSKKRRKRTKQKARRSEDQINRLRTISRLLNRWGFPSENIQRALMSLNSQLLGGTLNPIDIRSAIEAASDRDSDSDELFGPPIQTTSLPMHWLWYPYLPMYGLTVLAGVPGLGKSMLIALLIGIVTSGGRWPLSEELCQPALVLLLSAEDSFSRVTLARLEKAGFDIKNLEIMYSPRALTEERMGKLEDYIRDKRPALVVVDTLSHFMGGERDMHRQNEVGEFLGRLNDVAEDTGAAIVGIAHLNKQTGDDPLRRIVGSVGFGATVRSAIFLGTDPSDPQRLALGHGKASASPKGPTIVFERYGGGRHDVPKLVATDTIDADHVEICTPQKREPGRPSTQSEAARTHIMKELGKEPKPWSEVWQSADNWNIASEPTFNAVRAELAREGMIVQVGKGPKAKWKLAPGTNDQLS
ncbi:AAA family ATPase [Ruegeria arenilitoris]|uniref:AAA family ATPase n=1 Tax=Ruegeria arenilitoris TaxID=1173585 RepID=UPI00147FDBB5|nr:AAA family ATPase [Ruegeria arenilitoris]